MTTPPWPCSRYVSAELTWDEMCVLWNQHADELLKTYERLPE